MASGRFEEAVRGLLQTPLAPEATEKKAKANTTEGREAEACEEAVSY